MFFSGLRAAAGPTSRRFFTTGVTNGFTGAIGNTPLVWEKPQAIAKILRQPADLSQDLI
jgi:hypothetical protein